MWNRIRGHQTFNGLNGHNGLNGAARHNGLNELLDLKVLMDLKNSMNSTDLMD